MRIICLTAFLLSGCCPVLYTKHPGFSGRIVRADSHLPVVGVNVQLSELQYCQSVGSVMTTNIQVITVEKTDTNGVFYIPAPKEIGIYSMPMDIFPLEYRLDLIYNQKVFETHEYLHRSLSDKHFYELGDIMFEPPTANDITTRATREK